MAVLAVVAGAAVVIAVLADMVNTLVTTTTSRARWWLTRITYRNLWGAVRWVALRLPEHRREGLLAAFAPVSVLVLLVIWVTQQIVGFGLIWWGIQGISGVASLTDSLYYSGVVFFTVGFGEVVPAEIVPRFGAIVEAFCGVLTIALVIGYLPALYGAYSERERKLMLLDDGTEERITPTSLVINRAPDGDPSRLDLFFQEWEEWTAGVIETHSTFPMLRLFRSKDPGQHWVTALGLVTDAALHVQIVRGTHRGPQYWLLRRSIRLFELLTEDADLSEYRRPYEEPADEPNPLFVELYHHLEEHEFDLIPFDEAVAVGRDLRSRWGPQMEYLIDLLLAPRGFWGHAIGHRLAQDHDHLSEFDQG
jgi:hypothetical protein